MRLSLSSHPVGGEFSATCSGSHAFRPRSPPAVQLTPSFLPLSRFQTFDGLITRCLSSSAAPGWHCDRRGGGLRGHRARGGRDVPWDAATACDDLASGGGASAAGSRGTFASSRTPRAIRGFHTSSPARAGDYYETLGVARSASHGEIKKAYYKLAKKYHPDANKDDPSAETRFQEVQKAYETLRDPQSRGMYDQVGHGNYEQMENGGGGGAGGGFPGGAGGQGFEGFPGGFRMHFGGDMGGGGGGGGGMDFEELFSDFFGGMGAARDIQTTVRVTLAEVAKGTSKTIRIPETVVADPRTGARETVPARDVNVDLPRGVEDGQRLRVPGEGQRTKGRDGRERVGSLYINVDVVEDPRFARVGNDLVTRVELPFVDAALGGTTVAPTLDGGGGGEGAKGDAAGGSAAVARTRIARARLAAHRRLVRAVSSGGAQEPVRQAEGTPGGLRQGRGREETRGRIRRGRRGARLSQPSSRYSRSAFENSSRRPRRFLSRRTDRARVSRDVCVRNIARAITTNSPEEPSLERDTSTPPLS